MLARRLFIARLPTRGSHRIRTCYTRFVRTPDLGPRNDLTSAANDRFGDAALRRLHSPQMAGNGRRPVHCRNGICTTPATQR